MPWQRHGRSPAFTLKKHRFDFAGTVAEKLAYEDDNAEITGKDRPAARGMLVAAIAIAVVVALQVIYAATADLRTDEAYYWTLSKEYVLSYLDHPPMVAWMVRFGTAIFGDTNFGARFGGLLAMWVAVAILGDIVWRLTRDRCRCPCGADAVRGA
jgi:hypothetical protein